MVSPGIASGKITARRTSTSESLNCNGPKDSAGIATVRAKYNAPIKAALEIKIRDFFKITSVFFIDGCCRDHQLYVIIY